MTATPTPVHNVVWQPSAVPRSLHERANQHTGAVVWLTGLPGAGKSTLARAAQQSLHQGGHRTVLLDGDNLRHGLCADLGFSMAERNENVRRTAEVAKLFLETGVVVLVALVSPLRAARDAVRQQLPAGDFLEVYCQCPLPVCRARDPKGHYQKADSGALAEFTGVSSPYEAPLSPDLTLQTGSEPIEASVKQLMALVLAHVSRGSPERGPG
jgi:adenylylsulfate kinase